MKKITIFDIVSCIFYTSIILFMAFIFARGVYFDFKSSVVYQDQYQTDITTLSEKDFCFKYYADYRVNFLPVKCLKYFK